MDRPARANAQIDLLCAPMRRAVPRGQSDYGHTARSITTMPASEAAQIRVRVKGMAST